METMQKNTNYTTFAIALSLLCASAAAQAPQPKGFIANDAGGKCWYTQAAAPYGPYFHTGPGKSYHLTFDDPRCMRDSGLGLDINKMSILNNIARNYSHADAAFMTRPGELRRTSTLQIRGQCVQSAKYPEAAFVIEFEENKNSIQGVRHALAVLGCKN